MHEKLTARKIGNKIKLAREKAGLRQEDLANKINRHKSYISHLETGKGGYSINTLQQLVEPLGLKNISYFFQWDEPELKISDDIEKYKTSEILSDIVGLLADHPEAQQKVKAYLLSYHEGGKNNLSRLGGIVDALKPDDVERLITLLVKKLRERR